VQKERKRREKKIQEEKKKTFQRAIKRGVVVGCTDHP
jgi:hypothetical protein